MKQELRVGIVGLEHAIQDHLAKLLKMSDVEIVGAFDPDISKFDKANKILGTKLKFFNSYQELCFNSDAVVICSPDDVHFSQLMIAVKEYGCHVLVEKPILTQKSQVEEFKELLETTDKVITTCHPRRFDAMYVYVRELARKYRKKYGRIERFEMYFERPIPSENERKNYHDSLLSDHFCHELDYMNYVIGMKDLTVTDYSDGYDRYHVEGIAKDKCDTQSVHKGRPEPIRFVFNVERNLPYGSLSHEWMCIYFRDAVLKIDNLHQEECWMQYRKKKINSSGKVISEKLIMKKHLKLPKTDHNAKYEALNRNFIDSILGKAKPYLSKEEIFQAATMPLDYMHRCK